MWRFARFGSFVQFKKPGKHPWRSVTFNKVSDLKLKPGTLENLELKPGTLLHECFLRFLNCLNGNKLRKASQIVLRLFLKTTQNLVCPCMLEQSHPQGLGLAPSFLWCFSSSNKPQWSINYFRRHCRLKNLESDCREREFKTELACS